jgi:uncharacterized protein
VGRLRIDRLTGPPVRLVDARGRLIVARCHVADRPLSRAVGLLASPDLAADEGLLLPRCGSVHTLGMRRPVDIGLADATGRVLRVVPEVGAGRFVRAPGARVVIETPACSLAHLRAGDVLDLRSLCRSPS